MLNFYQVSVTALPGLSLNFVVNPEKIFSRIASQMLFSIFFRVMTNKMILIVIILLELGILGGVVYWKFFS